MVIIAESFLNIAEIIRRIIFSISLFTFFLRSMIMKNYISFTFADLIKS